MSARLVSVMNWNFQPSKRLNYFYNLLVDIYVFMENFTIMNHSLAFVKFFSAEQHFYSINPSKLFDLLLNAAAVFRLLCAKEHSNIYQTNKFNHSAKFIPLSATKQRIATEINYLLNHSWLTRQLFMQLNVKHRGSVAFSIPLSQIEHFQVSIFWTFSLNIFTNWTWWSFSVTWICGYQFYSQN